MNVIHIFAVAVFAQIGRRADNDVDAVDTRLDSNPGIVHVAANVCEDFGFQAEFADGLEVSAGLLRGCRGGEFDVLDAKVRQRFRDLYFFLGVKEGVGELLALSLLGRLAVAVLGSMGIPGWTR
jgi:hypothetical protein